TMAPSFKCAATAAHTGPIASIGTQTTTRSAPSTLLPMSTSARSMKPSSRALARTAGLASWPTISVARCCFFSTQPSDEPMRPRPISVTRSKWTGAPVLRGMGSAIDEVGERRDRGAHLGLVADGDAQAIREAVARHLAQDDAALQQELVGSVGVLAVGLGEAHEHEIA